MPPKKSKLAPPLPKNEVLTDQLKQKWILGSSIGKGGFGEIYMAAAGETAPTKDSDYSFAIKVEPHDSGPLFVERSFYLKTAKKDDVLSWMKGKKLKTLGMPIMHGSGSHEFNTIKYRFLVMDRYSKDLASVLESCNRIFPVATVLQISIQVLDILEYIHSYGYVHADVKASNLLLGLKRGTENQCFLVDFGLVSRINKIKDKKKKHNGTIEYLSRDAHDGANTCRGDMDILAFNMVHWLSAKLPWEGVTDCNAVQKAKESAMQKVPEFLKTCFGTRHIPDCLIKFVKYVSDMKLDDVPDYSKVRKMFLDGLNKEGVKFDSPLAFTKPLDHQNGNAKKVCTSPRKVVKRNKAVSAKPSSSSDANQDTESESEEEIQETKPKRSKVSSKAESEEKASWRNCPTVKASRVERPGELLPAKQKPKPRVKK